MIFLVDPHEITLISEGFVEQRKGLSISGTAICQRETLRVFLTMCAASNIKTLLN